MYCIDIDLIHYLGSSLASLCTTNVLCKLLYLLMEQHSHTIHAVGFGWSTTQLSNLTDEYLQPQPGTDSK